MELKISNLSFEYVKDKEILKNINCSYQSGDIVAILGVNGTGKSTLIKCLASIHKQKSGTIEIDGKNITSLKPNDRAKFISYVPQNIIFPNLSVYDSILIGRKPYIQFDPKKEDHEIVEKAITALELNELAFKNVNEISGGEKQKVAIARAMVQSSSVILFDEPTSSLDIKNQIEVIKLIKKIATEKNMIVLVVIHDINLALKLANKFLLLKNGEIYKDGDISVINKNTLDSLYGVDTNILEYGDEKIVIFK